MDELSGLLLDNIGLLCFINFITTAYFLVRIKLKLNDINNNLLILIIKKNQE